MSNRRYRLSDLRLLAVAVLACGVVVGLHARGQEGAAAAPKKMAMDKAPAAPEMSADAAELLKLDQAIGTAVVNGDTAYVDRNVSSDFSMVHGDAWTHGGKPLLTDTKASFMKRVATKYYSVLDFDSVKVEMHGDVGITYGRYLAHAIGEGAPDRVWFSVWYERVYAKRDGRWIYLSHRTVHGPTFGASREAVSDK